MIFSYEKVFKGGARRAAPSGPIGQGGGAKNMSALTRPNYEPLEIGLIRACIHFFIIKVLGERGIFQKHRQIIIYFKVYRIYFPLEL